MTKRDAAKPATNPADAEAARRPAGVGLDVAGIGAAAASGAGLHEVREYGDPDPIGRDPLDIQSRTQADKSIPEIHEVGIPDELREEIEEIIARYPQVRSASIPSLWAVQNRYGWCSPKGIRQAAAVMRVTPAFLESIASFYDQLYLEPVGTHRMLVCTNISCWMRGGDEMLEAFCRAAGTNLEEASEGGATSPEGDAFVTGFECMGACELAPMASINARYYGPLEPADAQAALAQLRAGEEVLPEKQLATRGAAGGPEPEPDPRVA